MRGLKYGMNMRRNEFKIIAPRVGAWIEVFGTPLELLDLLYIAPRVGAWIEVHGKENKALFA